MNTTQTTSSTLRLLRNRNFGLLWLSQTVSFVGDYFYFLAVPIIINRLTGSTLQIGISVMAFSIPQLFGFISGVFVDRWNRRATMIAADLLRAGLVLTCFLVRDADYIWVFYINGFLISIISIFFIPARDALMPQLVAEDELPTANGLHQVTRTAAFLAGPALAGFMLGLFGDTVAWIVDSASYVVSALFIFGIARNVEKQKHTELAGPRLTFSKVWADTRIGISFLFSSKTYISILGTISITMLGVGATNVLWVPMMQRYHGIGPEGLGLIDSIQGIGMAIGGLITGWLAVKLRLNWQVAVCVFPIGLMLSLTGLSPIFWPILVFGFILGMALTPVQALLITALQRGAPNHLRGRVMGGFNSVTGVAGLLSMGAASLLGEIVDLRTIYIVAGIVVAISGLLAARWITEPTPAPTAPVELEQPET